MNVFATSQQKYFDQFTESKEISFEIYRRCVCLPSKRRCRRWISL